MRHAWIFLAALGVLFSAPAAFAAPGEPAPVWRIVQNSQPTVFTAGTESEGGYAEVQVPQLVVTATNMGGSDTSGPIVLKDSLPVGLAPSPTQAPEVRNKSVSSGGPGTVTPCPIPAGQVVECTVEEPVEPGRFLILHVPVVVESTAPPVVESEFEISGGNAPSVVSSETTEIAPDFTVPAFRFLDGHAGLSISATAEDGSAPVAAGSHPYMLEVEAAYPSRQVEGEEPGNNLLPAEAVKELRFELPQGVVVNPSATSVKCSEGELIAATRGAGEGCPPASQVGEIHLRLINVFGTDVSNRALYNMEAPPGSAAELAFNALGSVIHVQGGLSSNLRLTATSKDILAKVGQASVSASLWANPSDPRHNDQREGLGCVSGIGCGIPASPAPFLTMPTSCTAAHDMAVEGRGWTGGETSGDVPLSGPGYEPITVDDCASVKYEPTISSQPTTNAADSPTGLDFKIHQVQDESFGGRATSPLRDAKVTLPEGLSLNPAGASGLQSCTEGQIGYMPVDGKDRFATEPQTCPDASKVGTVSVSSPLLDHPLPGSIFVAQPFANPFDSLVAIYLTVEDEQSGIVAKLAGKVEPDPENGQLTATFTENPELPIEDIGLHFFAGSNAPLTTPFVCGASTTTSVLTPWSAPEAPAAELSDGFTTYLPAGDQELCPVREAAAPKDLSFSAGTVSPLAGTFSPFTLRISRADGTQHITGIDTLLPQGLLGRLAGIPYCSEAALAVAKAREETQRGAEEQAAPACPSASEVGTVRIAGGAGEKPLSVSGHVYLAGPYKGAPLSLAVVVPAVAGPFDLGTVVNRVALNVGQYDARIHAVSDPLPTILEGIPLDVRSIELTLDHPEFTINPTSCEVSSITGSASTQPGQTASFADRFQVGGCGRLGFKPKLRLSLKGRTTRAGHPALTAMVTMPGGSANIARAQVGLPKSEFLDQGNLDKVCKQADLLAGTCAKGAIYGRAKAWTPLLDKPLEGPVYLGVGFGYKLPALVADLNGQVRILLKGKVDTTKEGGLRNTFEAVPDAPVSKFLLKLKGGPKYGLLSNSEDICKKPQRAAIRFTAQNGKVRQMTSKIGINCKAGA
jgi:hypothetical protein